MEQRQQLPSIDLRSIFLMLRRHMGLLFAGLVLGAALALALLIAIPPKFTATATLMVDSREQKILSDAIVAPIRPTPDAIASEAALIRSPSVLQEVAEKLNLINDPEFAVASPSTPGLLSKAKAQLFGLFNEPRPQIHDPVLELIDNLRESLDVKAIQYTNLMQINVTSKDPSKAAQIANAVTDAYLKQQIASRYTATRRATDWLKEQLEEQKIKLRKSEDRFERFKAQMDLIDKEGPTLEERQVVRLNEELVLARMRTAEARAKYTTISPKDAGRSVDNSGLSDIAQSTLLTQLRTQLAQVIRDEDSVKSRFGAMHPAFVRVQAEKQALNSQIRAEVQRILAITRNDFDVSTSREASLKDSLESAAFKTSNLRPEFVKLREIQRDAESDQAIYEAMLQRMKQAAAQENWKSSDLRVVAEAVPPLIASAPKSRVLVLGGLTAGLGLTMGLALLRELLDKSLKRGRDVEVKLGVPHLVNIPLLSDREVTKAGPSRLRSVNAFRFAERAPGSPFSDSMLGLLATVQALGRTTPIKTVMFTSVRPGEGKSVVAANFAQVAARSGLKALLICTDLRTPTTNWFGPPNEAQPDLIDYLNGKVEIAAAVVKGTEEASLDIMPAVTRAPNATSILASTRMQALLDWAKANYDLVVIDTVAIVTYLDGRMMARHADATILVGEWLKTRSDDAKEAVDLLLKHDASIAGMVLNKVDFRKAKLYGLSTLA